MMNERDSFDDEVVEILNGEFQGKCLKDGYVYYLVDRFINPVEFLGVRVEETLDRKMLLDNCATVVYNGDIMELCEYIEVNVLLERFSKQALIYIRE